MGAQNEPRRGSAPLGPPRGYATGLEAFSFIYGYDELHAEVLSLVFL